MTKKTRISLVVIISLILAAGAGFIASTQTKAIESFLQVEPVNVASTKQITETLAPGVRKADKNETAEIQKLGKQSKTWVGNANGGYFQVTDFGKRSDVVAGQVNNGLAQTGQFTQTYALKGPQIFIADTKYAANSQNAQMVGHDVGAFAGQMLQQLPQLSKMTAKQINKDFVVVGGYSDAADEKKGQVKEYISFVFTRDQYGNLHMISVESRQDKASVAKNIATLSNIGHTYTGSKPDNVSFAKHVEK